MVTVFNHCRFGLIFNIRGISCLNKKRSVSSLVELLLNAATCYALGDLCYDMDILTNV